MLTRSLALLAITLSLCGLAGCSSTPTTAGAGSPRQDKITDIKGLFPVLKKGMTAEVVRQKLGDPAEIKPMASADGKAEVWVYHFEKSVGMTQIATSTIEVPTFGMGLAGPFATTAPEPVYTLAEKKAMVTLSLLMFNGQLAAQKAGVENGIDFR